MRILDEINQRLTGMFCTSGNIPQKLYITDIEYSRVLIENLDSIILPDPHRATHALWTKYGIIPVELVRGHKFISE